MDGMMSIDPKPERVNGSQVVDEAEHQQPHFDGKMEIDSRSNARGQTEEQIRQQERKVMETVTGLWSKSVVRKQ